MSTITAHWDDTFYFESVVFQVEDVLFRVPRRAFENDSEIFRDMQSLPDSPGTPRDGFDDEHPLRLEGINKDEFKQLLRVMFPSHLGQPEILTAPQWAAVLRLSTLWSFQYIRTIAIDALSREQMDPVEKFVLAGRYGVHAWVVPTLNDIARRPEPLSINDVDRLGIDTVLKIAQVREALDRGSFTCRYCWKKGDGVLSQDARELYNFSDKIRSVFQLNDETPKH